GTVVSPSSVGLGIRPRGQTRRGAGLVDVDRRRQRSIRKVAPIAGDRGTVHSPVGTERVRRETRCWPLAVTRQPGLVRPGEPVVSSEILADLVRFLHRTDAAAV